MLFNGSIQIVPVTEPGRHNTKDGKSDKNQQQYLGLYRKMKQALTLVLITIFCRGLQLLFILQLRRLRLLFRRILHFVIHLSFSASQRSKFLLSNFKLYTL